MTARWLWYTRRLRQMSPAEVLGRVTDAGRRIAWRRQQVLPGVECPPPPGVRDVSAFTSPLPASAREHVSSHARTAVTTAADRLLDGEWDLLGINRSDIGMPDWFFDPVTGRRAPDSRYAFGIDHRDEEQTGNVKGLWELSRHHHLTVLASAYWLSGEDRYAEAVDTQLRSWWSANPFLSGVHWTSGIELGVRLISWAWIRRLLDEWPGVTALFSSDDGVRQIWWHQKYLASFSSRGSSANNHLVAEAAGRVVGAAAFPWFRESRSWHVDAARQLQDAFRANTYPTGLNRELATDYHRFVTELVVLAAVESDAAGLPFTPATWELVVASFDVAAALSDLQGRPPRQGDGDDGRGLVVDFPERDAWSLLLDLGAATVGALPWWPETTASVLGVAAQAIRNSGSPVRTGRPTARPSVFPDAGICLLRTPDSTQPEIWCRCDGGPHGFLSIAAHAHADALAVEVRHDGVEILADPGTYCYHGQPDWRHYFRSTRAHNTVEIGGVDQSESGGPFMWLSKADTTVTRVEGGVGPAEAQTWSAHHDGYTRLEAGLRHTRTVTLHPRSRVLTIRDRLSSKQSHPLRLMFHLGPAVSVNLIDDVAHLSWPGRDGPAQGRLHLPVGLSWTWHRAETDPALGWYSPRFGVKTPTTTLVGAGLLEGPLELASALSFDQADTASAKTVRRGVGAGQHAGGPT